MEATVVVPTHQDGSLVVSRLCEKCNAIFTNWQEFLNSILNIDGCENLAIGECERRHYTSIDEVEASAKHGCTLCIQLVRSADSQNTKISFPTQVDAREFGLMKIGRFNENGFVIELSVEIDWERDTFNAGDISSGQKDLLHLQVIIMPMSGNSDRIRALSPQLSFNTKDSVPLINSWLQECQGNHPLCRISDVHFLPTRLISLDSNHPRLVFSSEIGDSPKYATLSHCWGNHKFTTLDTTNLDTFRARIPVSALSQTFHDAFLVAKNIGINYIWIDSLCILQDDAQDWKKESVMMSAVYSNSSINIAATTASDGTFGLFSDRKGTSVCQVSLPLGDGVSLHHCAADELYAQAFRNMPLLKRGWTLQERLLPSRSVHFASKEVLWECHSMIACETLPFGIPLIIEDSRNRYFNKKPFTSLLWAWAISTYSQARLTVESDKLVAVAGLAQKIHAQTGVRYIAGLWEDDLKTSLLWGNGPHFAMWHARPTSYRAPSWSWASVDGEIIYGTRKPSSVSEDCVRILQARVEPCDSFVQVTGGTMELQCNMLAKCDLYRYSGVLLLADHWSSLDVETNLDIPQEDPVVSAYLVPFWFDQIESSSVHPHVTGLLLRATGQKPGEYVRLGIFEMWELNAKEPNDLQSTILWSFFSMQPDAASPSDSIRTVVEDGKTRFVIEIV